MNRLLTTAIAQLVFVSPAFSEPSASEVLNLIDGSQSLESNTASIYLHGIHTGLLWAEVFRASGGHDRSFCEPNNPDLNQEYTISILRPFVEANPEVGEQPVGAVLLGALISTYPCPE